MASLLSANGASFSMSSPPLTTPPPIFHGIDLRQEPTPTQSDCDGRGIMHCGGQLGYCYGGPEGFIGCCTTTSCAARTTCIPYSELSTRACDFNTGGCVPCSNPVTPECFTLTNPEAGIYAMYCTTAGAGGTLTSDYVALAFPTSIAAGPQMVLGDSSAPETFSSPAPTPASVEPISSEPPLSTSSSEPDQTDDTSTSTSSAPSSSDRTYPAAMPDNSSSATSSKSNTNTKSGGGSTKLSGGAIAGIAVGAAVVASAIVVILILLMLKRRKRKGHQLQATESSNFYKEVVRNDSPPPKRTRSPPRSFHEAHPARAVRYSELPDTSPTAFGGGWFSGTQRSGSDAPVAASDGPDWNSNINTARPSTDEPPEH